jgi:putative flippase GtrA
MRRVLPTAEVIRFLLVGGFNTVFSIGLAWLIVHPIAHFFPRLHLSIVVLASQIITTPIAITVAFLGYKWFVFRTHGNYLKEWLKCFAVYSVSIPAPFLILPVATNLFLHYPITKPHAPLLALIVNSGAIACYSYFAHKKFSFKR